MTVSAVLLMLYILEADLLNQQETDIQLKKEIKHCIVEDIGKQYTESKLAEDVILIL